MDNPGTSVPSDGFLTSLLDTVDCLPKTACFDFNVKPEPVTQTSAFLTLPDEVLVRIASFIPIWERILVIGCVSTKLRKCVKESITSLTLFKDHMDGLSDDRLRFFLSKYGSRIQQLNFDLFRSSTIQQCTQWVWRQSVVTSVNACRNLRELSILVCNRHRLRDADLIVIFKEAPQLTALSIDAQYLNGHCFQKAPANLTRLEMEMCYRITDTAMKSICGLKKLQTLHMSQLLALKDTIIRGLVTDLRCLTDLSIVSHQDSVYTDLTCSGLAQLARIPRLKSLCLEGLGAVTDKFLTEFCSDRFPAHRTLRGLSLAYCYNFGMSGIQSLAGMERLEDLNLDGVAKRDISIGLEKVARSGNLVRLLLAERTNVSPESLMTVVQSSPKLRLLDVTNNDDIMNWHFAQNIVNDWASRRNPQLTILTNAHLPWGMVRLPRQTLGTGYVPVKVVHVHRGSVPSSEVHCDSVLSPEESHQLPPGLLCPKLRRGNRYRLLWETLGPGKELNEDKENWGNTSPLGFGGSDLTELAAQHFQQDMNAQAALNYNPIQLPSPGEPSPFGNMANMNQNPYNSYTNMSSMMGSQSTGNCGPGGLSMTSYNPIPPMDVGLLDIQYPPMTDYQNNRQASASNSPALPSGFSHTPISPAGDPHTRDWSMDVISLLMTSHAYPDGARVGPMDTKEGLVFQPNGLVCAPDPLFCLTEGSGGAPRPPVEIPKQPGYHHTRGPRPSRRSVPKAPPQKQEEPIFQASDFPPLSSLN